MGCDGILGALGARRAPGPVGTPDPGPSCRGERSTCPSCIGHQHRAGAELHPLPTGNLEATFKLIYLLPRVWSRSRAWHFLPTPGPLWSLEYLSLTHVSSRAQLCCKG